MMSQVVGDAPVLGDGETAPVQEFTPQLSGMGMEKTVTVFNPLPHDFRVKYARSIATNPSLDPGLQFAKDKTGLDLSKRTTPTANMEHTIVLKAKTEVNLPGDIAQIAVRKLVSAIIQNRNDDGTYNFERGGQRKSMVADPHLRQEVEKEVIRETKDTMSFMNRETPAQYTDRQIQELNNPEVKGKADDNPAPGTGVHYDSDTAEKTVSGGSGKSGPTPTETTSGPKEATSSK